MEKLQWDEICMTEADGSVTICKIPTLTGLPGAPGEEKEDKANDKTDNAE